MRLVDNDKLHRVPWAKKDQKKNADTTKKKVGNKKPVKKLMCNDGENYQHKFAWKYLDKRP